MKKLLAIVLAVVIAVGVFAVGASAVPFTAREQPAQFVITPASGDWDWYDVPDLREAILALQNRLFDAFEYEEPILLAYWGALRDILEVARRDLSGAEYAAKRAEYRAAQRALEAQMDALNARTAVLFADEATLRAALADGRVEAYMLEYLALHTQSYELTIAFWESLIVPAAMVAVYAMAQLNFASMTRYFPQDNESEFHNAEDALFEEFIEDIMTALEDGEWEAAAAVILAYKAAYIALVEEFSGTVRAWPGLPGGNQPVPPWHETLPAFVQWILRWIFFGWIWM